MTTRNLINIAAAIALLLASAVSSAAPIVLDFNLKGAFTNAGLNNAAFNAGPGNTLVGRDSQGEHRAYWVFDLSGVTQAISSATLSVGVPAFGYISSDATETLGIFDYVSAISLLQNQSTTFPAGVTAFNDLGSGDLYASKVISNDDEPDCFVCNVATFEPLLIELTGADFLADINAARGGLFAFGGALTTLSGPSTQVMFAFSGNQHNVQLILNAVAVPEPASLALILLAFAALAVLLRGGRCGPIYGSSARTHP